MTFKTLYGDSRLILPTLKTGSVQQVFTSPPYFGQRRYGPDPEHEIGWGDIGHYLDEMGAVLDELHRVTDTDATVWYVIADKRSGCVDEDTLALTKRGWLRHDQILVGDEIMTWNPDLWQPEWGFVEAMNVHEPEPRPMLVAEHERGHSSVTTLDHRWITERRTGRAGTRRYQREWATSESLTSEHRVPITGKTANLPTVKTISDAMVELVAWHYTEGHDRKNPDGTLGGIIIGQSIAANPDKVDRLTRCLAALWPEGLPAGNGRRWSDPAPTWSRAEVQPGLIHFRLNSIAAAAVRRWTGESKVPSMDFLTALTQDQLELFIDTSIIADGCYHKGAWAMSQIIYERVIALQVAATLAGIATTVTGPHARPQDYNRKPRWTVQERTRQNIKPLRSVHRVEVRDEMVWCPTTNNGTWLAMRDGTVWFTGNSGGAGGDHTKTGKTRGSKHWIPSYGKPVYGNLTGGQAMMVPFLFAQMAQQSDWLIRSVIIWDKSPNVKPEDPKHINRPMFAHEFVFILAKHTKHRWHHRRLVEKGDVWHVKPHRGSRAVRHYAPFPAALPERAILAASEAGDVILDPFAGSMTTPRVASDLGRRGIGIELYDPSQIGK